MRPAIILWALYGWQTSGAIFTGKPTGYGPYELKLSLLVPHLRMLASATTRERMDQSGLGEDVVDSPHYCLCQFFLHFPSLSTCGTARQCLLFSPLCDSSGGDLSHFFRVSFPRGTIYSILDGRPDLLVRLVCPCYKNSTSC